MPTPEELARHNIDALLIKCGWVIQDHKKLDLAARKEIATNLYFQLSPLYFDRPSSVYAKFDVAA